jgi:hypothetical protein
VNRRIYTLDLMAAGRAAAHTARMRASEAGQARRDPDNELYDRGSDLVLAATAIRDAVGLLDATRAAPALLGCVEAAMRELVMASAALEQTILGVCAAPAEDARVARMRRGLTNLSSALGDAEAAAAAARPPAARALAGSPRERGGPVSR